MLIMLARHIKTGMMTQGDLGEKEFSYGKRKQKRNTLLYHQLEKIGQWDGIILKVNGMMN